MASKQRIEVRVNETTYVREVEPRLTLADFLRHELHLGGTHVGCEHGICGACTVLIDGHSARACLTLAVQTDGSEVTTVEGLRDHDTGALHPIQQAFVDGHGLQCGFCTPGFMMTTLELLRDIPDPNDDQIKDALGGNLCRCTGYQSILDSVKLAARRMKSNAPT
ncbi:MAG: (2Fe-2S)-binding protein [Comamonadaceae bacterium]|nr:(2Fe-2S)-binding protein [Pseudomonadota bacterium]MBS0608084.1 (2Fe-2S)-binding protein [Pseudomonadota bacterium]MDE2413396.1 (2Fe-2S)-binding protein [Comamonadaceae bacterium]